MKATRLVTLALTAALAAAFAVPSMATAAAKPVVVATDDAGDWGGNVDPTIGPAGAALGMDLTEGTITMADKTTVNFIIKLASLPPSGGIPEGVRYTWDFTVNGKLLQLDGKFTNYSRGACDVTNGQCPPPRDPGMQPFLLRGACAPNPTVTNLVICEELGLVKATFDSAAGTITIPVPLAMMGAKAGTKIEPGTNTTFGASINAIPSAFVSSGNMPFDAMTTTATFTVPKK